MRGLYFWTNVCAALTATVLLAAHAVAQSSAGESASDATMGFETPSGWRVLGENVALSSTIVRTQGKFALEVKTRLSETRLISERVASTAQALYGLKNHGSAFEIDVQPRDDRHDDPCDDPTQPASRNAFTEPTRDVAPRDGRSEGSPNGHCDHASRDHPQKRSRSYLQLLVSCPSCGLARELVGTRPLAHLRPGIYSSLKFPLSDSVQDALGGAAYEDLRFELVLKNDTEEDQGYLFDNLRVHSVVLEKAGPGTTTPPGYGGSVDLVAIGNAAASQAFSLAPVQVPSSLHLMLGSAGTTLAKLDLGYNDGQPVFTCTYAADRTDASEKSYSLSSCTGGAQAGDLVPAAWAQLTIPAAAPTMKIRAQLARNPVGDLVGGNIIPPMPTYWGDYQTCVPAPQRGQVVTISASCAAQIAEISGIISTYFDEVRNSDFPEDWVVTPTPEFARRHGDGSPHDNTQGAYPPPNDPPFDQEGHINKGGPFDAYWRLSGDLGYATSTSTGESTTDFQADFSLHAVLLGNDADVLEVDTVANTDSGTTQPSYKPPTTSGKVTLMIFGVELPPNGYSADPHTGFNVNPPPFTQDFNLPSIQFWIFGLTLGLTTEAGVTVNGAVAPSGINLVLEPYGSVGAHIDGSVSIGVASGGVDARIDLLEVETPVTAAAQWSINTEPAVCSVSLAGSINGALTLSSGGGEVDLNATLGACPFCVGASTKLFGWDPIATYSKPLFNSSIAVPLAPLPTQACTAPLSVVINSPLQGAQLQANQLYPMQGTATGSGLSVPCSDLHWSLTGGGMFAPPANPCGSLAASFTSASTINLSATATYTDAWGRQIVETGTATPVSITVNPLPPGVYVEELVAPSRTVYFCTSSVGLNGIPVTNCTKAVRDAEPPGTIQGSYTLVGLVSGAAPPVCTTWTGTDPNGHPLTLQSNNPGTTTPSVTFSNPPALGQYTFTMSTVKGSCGAPGATAFGTTTVNVLLQSFE